MSRVTNNAQVAMVAHEANRALQRIQGDPVLSPPWDDAPDWQRESAIDGVQHTLEGVTPETLHAFWCTHKIAQGWRYGPVKDGAERTHPCLVPYDNLPAEQRVKDALFIAIVGALS